MRKRFEQQLVLGRIAIGDVQLPIYKRRSSILDLCAALQRIFVTSNWNERIFELIESKVLPSNNRTGRPGMDLWHIFVLAQVRLCQNISFDELHHIANHDRVVRQIMGVENWNEIEYQHFNHQTIIDNVSLLDNDTLQNINEIIVAFGHKIFKKKEEEALCLKTDSFVVKSNVHFPTDYNLLWDSARKCLDMISKFKAKHNISGWRKIRDWRKEMKIEYRKMGKAFSGGGIYRQNKIIEQALIYITKSKALAEKVANTIPGLPMKDASDTLNKLALGNYYQQLIKHIDLLQRRIINSEQIPHEEKVFSIFEPHTEWINKGKLHPNVELGKKVSITTDQYNLIVDYYIMENESDSEIVSLLISTIIKKYKIRSWSFDKGYWHKNNKELLTKYVEMTVMPKKGKKTIAETEEEHRPLFKKMRNKHSAVESNINELEHRGLDRCPSKGYTSFKRYIGLSICAYNLRKIGHYLLETTKEKSIAWSPRAA